MNGNKLFRAAVFINIIAMLLYSGVVAYLGTFTRSMGDDYCEAALFQSGNVVGKLVERYLTVSDRFSNILFVGLTELAGPNIVRILPFIMLVLWLVGLTWLLSEVNKRMLGWPQEIVTCLALVVGFITVVQAPNRYQVFYWRSAMSTHFVPLVLLGYVVACLLLQLRFTRERTSVSVWTLLALLFASFLVGSFSEPPVAVMIVGLGIAFLYAWFMIKTDERRLSLYVLISALAGSCLALMVMMLAPANSLRLSDAPTPTLLVLVERSFRFALGFVLDWIRTLPVPALFTLTASFLVSLGQSLLTRATMTDIQRKRVLITMLIVPLISYLLIVASFAPSVYGQSYPVERARFAGQYILVIALMIEGAGLGILFAQWRPPLIASLPLSTIEAILLIIAAIYPVRAALLTLRDVPEYSARAEAWDKRDAMIRSLRAQGQTDLIVAQFNGVYGVKELDFDPQHWINVCAAAYYQVNTIRAVPMKDP